MVQLSFSGKDIMQSARINSGLERMEEIKFAVIEKDGTISIIPFEEKSK